MDINYEPEPIILGLAGRSGSGKTATADALAPQASLGRSESAHGTVIVWDHLAFALPLKQIVAARQGIEGDSAFDRVHYEIHSTLLDAFGSSPLYGAPPYDDLVQLVYQLAEAPCPDEGKARSFLQYAGTLCREHNKDVWVNWVDKKIKEGWIRFLQDAEKEEDEATDDAILRYGVVVSDCRLRNELEWVRSKRNGILIKLDVDPAVARMRQKHRDGHEISELEDDHLTENELDSISEDYFDAVIDTSNIQLKEQVRMVRDVVDKFT